MLISIIAALFKNNVIGKNNKLLWDIIPNDLKWFKKNTINKNNHGKKNLRLLKKTSSHETKYHCF